MRRKPDSGYKAVAVPAYFGRWQLAILRSTIGRWFDTSSHPVRVQRAALGLHDRGLLARDPKSSYRFTATQKGEQALFTYEDALARRIGHAA